MYLPKCLFGVCVLFNGFVSANERKPTEIVITATGTQGSVSATRLPIDAHENPRSVETVGKDDLDNSNPSRIEDQFSYLSGVTDAITQGGFNTSAFIRGFGTTGGQVFVNGHLDNTRFYIRDYSTIERVEILKGHSSVLYGSGSPGGSINYITKKPSKYAKDSIGFTLGSRKLKRFSLDKNGNLSKDDSLSYRLIATGQGADHFYDNASNDRWVVAPSFLWKPNSKNEVSVDLEVANTNMPFLFGTVYAKGQFQYDQSYIDPRARSDRNFYNFRSVWSHRFNDKWNVHTNVAYYKTKRKDLLIGLNYKVDENTLQGYYRKVQDDHSQYITRAEVRGINVGKKSNHNIIFGIEKNKDNGLIDADLITDFYLNIQNPQFDTDFSQLVPKVRQYRIKNSEVGIYAIDKIDLNEKWNLLVGGRYSSYETDFLEDGLLKLRSHRAMSKSIALNYHPTKSFSVYGSAAESFFPNSGQDRNKNFFDPKEALQYELGFRKLGKRYSFQTSVFQIVRDNLLTADPENRQYRILAGEETVRGFETAVVGTLTPQLDVKATATYLDAEVTKSNNGFQGNTPANVPKYSGSIRFSYRPEALQNASFKLGIVAVGKKPGNRRNELTVPSYGRVDFGVKHKHQKTTYSLNVRNVFDKKYVAAAYGESYVYRGAPRTVWFSANYKF